MMGTVNYILLNILLIFAYMVVLFFTLVGIDVVFEMNTWWGFICTIICGLSITLCSCYAAINVNLLKKPKP
jgi:hypothetical protein